LTKFTLRRCRRYHSSGSARFASRPRSASRRNRSWSSHATHRGSYPPRSTTTRRRIITVGWTIAHPLWVISLWSIEAWSVACPDRPSGDPYGSISSTRDPTATQSGCSSRYATCRASRFGRHRSSASIRARYRPRATATPSFSDRVTPAFGRRTTTTRASARANASISRDDPSVDPSSTMTNSKSANVWSSTLRTASARYRRALYTGMTTDTAGAAAASARAATAASAAVPTAGRRRWLVGASAIDCEAARPAGGVLPK
jgi:hypothetical protein